MFRKFSRSLPRRFKKYENKSVVNMSEEVRYALEMNEPIVALESTIVTHGMPFPDNVACAKAVEETVRRQGAIPATIAILNGKIKVGLSQEEMEMLGDVKYSNPVKTSRRDFPFVLSDRRNGGTTVAGTLVVATRAGIRIFATGGIGGVHRDVQDTFDVSADLTELGRSNVAVVSSGIKAILDIPKTLEYLETQGVCVVTFGNKSNFPAFYSRTSNYKAPYCVKDAVMAAEMIKSAAELNIQSGMLFAVPIPEKYSMDPDEINSAIEDSLHEAKESKISGKNITPYLLSKVAELTKGKSLEANIALIKHNAKTAADIAVCLYKLEQGDEEQEEVAISKQGQPIIIGGSNLDWTVNLDASEVKLDGRIHFGNFSYSGGGVARNICEALIKLGCQPAFITAVGDDQQGELLKNFIPEQCRHGLQIIPDQNTAQCITVSVENGDCPFLVGDMSIHSRINSEMIKKNEGLIKKSPLMILDGNLSTECIASALEIATRHDVPVLYEPTDIMVSTKPFQTSHWKAIKLITPNLNELRQIIKHLNIPMKKTFETEIEEVTYVAKALANHIENIIVTMGPKGLLIARRGLPNEPFLAKEKTEMIQIRHYPSEEVTGVVNVSGAGDCLASGLVAALLRGLPEENCVSVGFASALTALYSKSPVPMKIFNSSHSSWKKPAKYITLEVN